MSMNKLSKWEIKDIEELLEEEPELVEKTSENLKKLIQKLYIEADDMFSECMRLESKAETIRKYMENR